MVFDKQQHKAELAFGRIGGRRVILVKPQTYVNASGEAVGPLARFYKVPPESILAIYDDLDLPQGTIRVRPRGSSGGHNGIKSLDEHLGSQNYSRIRVGIGRPPGRMEPQAYVLQDFGDKERALMEEVYERVVAAVEMLIREGVGATMNAFNARPPAVDASAS